jgi:hypothetical protein
MVLAFAQFAIPDATKSEVFALEGLYNSITISVPPGAWPAGLTTGPNAAVFTPPGERRKGMNVFSVGPYVSFGPTGVNFTTGIIITCPFNLTGIDEGNLEIRVHKYHTSSKTYSPLPYPVRLSHRRGDPVNRERGSVEATVTVFDPPYIALATRISGVTPILQTDEIAITRYNSNQTLDVGSKEKTLPLIILVSAFVAGIATVVCCGGFYIAYRTGCFARKTHTKPLEEDGKKTKNLKRESKANKNEKLIADGSTVEADIILMDSINGEAEAVETTNDEKTPAANLREKTTVEVAI